jgi:AraC-like DNA-binding protein
MGLKSILIKLIYQNCLIQLNHESEILTRYTTVRLLAKIETKDENEKYVRYLISTSRNISSTEVSENLKDNFIK